MAFSEADRVQIRHFVGAASLWLQAFPMLENAITSIQSTADGGTRPDSSTETFVRGLVTSAQSVETKMTAQWDRLAVGRAEDVTLDAARALAALRAEGRRLSGSIARTLGMRGLLADVWSAPQVLSPEEAFGRVLG